MNVVNKFRAFWRSSYLGKVEAVCEFYWLLKSQCFYRVLFGHIGKHSKLLNPLRLKDVHNIHIGDNVLINKHCFLLTLQIDHVTIPRLVIDDGSVIGHFNHITCVEEVHIGRKVLTADRVHISDNSHVFADHCVPIMDQEIISRGKVIIGDGTWLGENVSVISCKIGRNCIIGANAVVVTDIPDYCVAVGIPARVIKEFNPKTKTWEKASKK